MKLPQLKSRARKVLESLVLGPVTVHQGIERHGDMNVSIEMMRNLYDGLVTSGAATRVGIVYTASPLACRLISDEAAKPIRIASGQENVEGQVALPRYAPNWKSPALNPQSAKRYGFALGLRDVRP